MPLILKSTDEVAIHTSVALFGQAPSNALYASYKANVAQVGEMEFANNAAASYANLSAGDFTVMVMDNLGLTAANIGADLRAGLQGVVTSIFADATYAPMRGYLSLALARLVASIPSADTNYGVAATALRAGADAAFVYSSDVSSVSSISLMQLTANVRLTSGVDTLSANVFTSVPAYTPGGTDLVNTLQNEDVLTGSGANPTLNATIGNSNDNGNSVITPTLNGIRTANVTFAHTDGTALDLQDAAGLEVVNITRVSLAGAGVLNLQGTATTLSVANTQARPDILITYINEALAGTNAVSLTLNKVNADSLSIGSADDFPGNATEQIETLTINVAEGGASSVWDLNTGVDSNATSAQAIVINAGANFALGNDTDDSGSILNDGNGLQGTGGINSITVTGAGSVTLSSVGGYVNPVTGGVAFTLAGAAATGAIAANITNAAGGSASSITTGSGADTIVTNNSTTLSADVTTGAGNDVVRTRIDAITTGSTAGSRGSLTASSTISTGEGDDTIGVGGLAGSTAGGAQIDAGAGNDNINVLGELGEEASIVGGAGNDVTYLAPTASLTPATILAGDSSGAEADDGLGAAVRAGEGDDQIWLTLRGTALGDYTSNAVNRGRIDGGAGSDIMWVRGNKDIATLSAGATDEDKNGVTDTAITGVETLTLDSEAGYGTTRANAINGNSKEANDMPNVVTANDNDGETADYIVNLAQFDAALDTINLIHRDGVVRNKGEEETSLTGFDGDAATYTLRNVDRETITLSAFETQVVNFSDTATDDRPVGADLKEEQGNRYDSGRFGVDVTIDLTAAAATDSASQRIVLNDTTAAITGILAAGIDNYDVQIISSSNPAGAEGPENDLTLEVNTDNDHGIDLSNDFADSLVVEGTGTGNLQIVNVDSASIDTSAFAGTVYIGVESEVDHVITTGANDDIVRLGDDGEIELGTDQIDLGDGDDIVVFNGEGSTAGIDSSDTVMGGAGMDELAIGGTGGLVSIEPNIVKLDASEWTEVSGFEVIRIGVGTATNIINHATAENTVSFGNIQYGVGEQAGQLVIPVTRTNTDGAASVSYTFGAGTAINTKGTSLRADDLPVAAATEGSDADFFVDGAQVVEFVDGQATAFITINIVADNQANDFNVSDDELRLEDFSVTLGGFSGVSAGAVTTANVVIGGQDIAAPTEPLRIGNDLNRPDRYDFEVTNEFVDTNGMEASGFTGDTGMDVLRIINDTEGNSSSDLILDIRALNRFNQVNLSGGVGEDRVIFSDVPLDGRDTVDGGASDSDVLEVRNDATVTTSDLRNVSNFESLEFVNDRAVEQTLFLTLNDSVINSTGIDTIRTFGGGAAGSDGTFAVTTRSAAILVLNAQSATIGLTVDMTAGGESDADDVIRTGSGSDSILSANGSDVIDAGGGNDTVRGSDGDDSINGGADNDSLVGGGEDDTLVGGAGQDTLEGGTENDLLIINGTADMAAAESYSGGGQIDTLRFTADTVVPAVTIADDIEFYELLEDVDVTVGATTVTGKTFVLIGSDGDESFTVVGTDVVGGEVIDLSLVNTTDVEVFIDAGDGDDTISGAAGNTTFIFNTGDVDAGESVTFDVGDNTFRVDSTTDFSAITASLAGLDTVNLASGTTATFSGASVTTLAFDVNGVAGGGTESLVVNAANGGVTVSLANIAVSDVAVFLNGGTGSDSLTGTAFDDSITGGAGSDTIVGGDGSDSITGGDGSDDISGGDGDDTITGGLGADVLTDGAGADTYVFGIQAGNVLESSATNLDSIVSFDTGFDKLNFGLVAGSGSNLREILHDTAAVGVTDLEDAISQANEIFSDNVAADTLVRYVLVYGVGVSDANAYLLVDRDENGEADDVVELTGINASTLFAPGDIVGP